MFKRTILAVISMFILTPAVSRAGDAKDFKTSRTVSEFPFERGDWEFQALGGAFVGIEQNSEKRPQTNDADVAARLGVMLTNPFFSGWVRGNLELLIEAFGAKTFEGPSGELAGGTLLLRYNFLQPQAHLIPYLQIGAGALYDDLYQHETQRLIGSAFEFNLQASLGARYLLSRQWALAFEGTYRHISNANTAARNLGLNSIGGFAGVSYFF